MSPHIDWRELKDLPPATRKALAEADPVVAAVIEAEEAKEREQEQVQAQTQTQKQAQTQTRKRKGENVEWGISANAWRHIATISVFALVASRLCG